jgi:predicted ATPase/class 3 adenylate cyclase
MPDLPTGTVTFLFTDIEGSTRLLQELGESYEQVLDDHARLLRRAIQEGRGVEIRTEGDSFFAVFGSATGAVRGAVQAQRALAANSWSHGGPLRVRMGMHTGEGRLGGDDYLGIDVNRAARIAAAGHGGQVLLSEATRALVEHALPRGVSVRDLGQHRLKDLAHPEHLHDLVIEGLVSDFLPLRSLEVPTNLPLQLTSFLGRSREVAQAVALLAEHRLVTLTGPGGTGKTRLALEVATSVLPDFPDGVWFVDLAPVSDPGLVIPAIAQALGVREERGRALADTLADHLRVKRLLLVPDNFEHLLEASNAIERLLGMAPELRVLATSRAPLGLYGEQEQHVPPLPLPDLGRLPKLEVLEGYEVMALFVERGRTARPDFALNEANARAVAEICGRLDGLPLAIELAATRLKILSPQAILVRLSERLDLLTATGRTTHPRQRSLRGAIEWSFDLLDEPEQRLFARLSVFAGGADVEAVEAVANPEGELRMDTLNGLVSLVDKSLVRQTETAEGDPRFGMLETIKQFARERLDRGMDGPATRRRHAEHFLALAADSEPHLVGKDQAAWLERWEREHDNLQAALRWAIEAGETGQGMRAAAAMWRFWHQRGHFAVGRTLLERQLAEPDVGRTATRAKAHGAAGSLAYWQTDPQGTEGHYEESLAIYRELGDKKGIADGVYNIAFVPILRGQHFEQSRHMLEQALGLYREIGDEEGIAKSKGDIAFFLTMEGEYEKALPLVEEAVARSRTRGDMFHLADDLLGLGQINRLLGNHEDSRAAYLQALDILERADSPAGIASALQMMSPLEGARGRHDRAVRLFAAAEAINESIGGGHPPEASLIGDPVGEAREALGDEVVDRAIAEGRAMTRGEAVAYAREEG